MQSKILFITGVSGSGKTTIGQLAAQRLGWLFADGDAFHPPENIEKMRSGQPLDDEDRAGWLAAIRDFSIKNVEKGQSVVVACSALKAKYRAALAGGLPTKAVKWAHLVGDFDLILKRLEAREGHFMPTALLVSQFEIWEKPSDDGLILEVSESAERLAELIEKWIF